MSHKSNNKECHKNEPRCDVKGHKCICTCPPEAKTVTDQRYEDMQTNQRLMNNPPIFSVSEAEPVMKPSERIRASDSLEGGYVPDYDDLVAILDEMDERIKKLEEKQ